MARILFAWELGAGTGHLSPYQTLVSQLVGMGHEVYFAAREVADGHGVLRKTGAKVIQAPFLLGQPPLFYDKPLNFAQILHNVGFHESSSLGGRVRAWLNLFDLVQPALLVADHAPTALLASHGSGIRRVALGSSFLVPPRTEPFPNMRDWLKIDNNRLLAQESLVRETANQVLRQHGLPRLEHLHELYEVDEARLTTFVEMDHYFPREARLYVGIGASGEGVPPQWPEGNGKRIFVYLKKTRFLRHTLLALQQSGCSVVVRVAGMTEKERQGFSSRLRFADRHVSMSAVQQSADVMVSNGNHGAIAHTLLAGIPQLLLPDTLERVMVSRRVARFGAGEIVNVGDKDIAGRVTAALNNLLTNDRYRQAATRFADKYADYNVDAHDQILLNIIVGVLP